MNICFTTTFGILYQYNIKDNTGYYQLLLYIKCVSVFWEKMVSSNGSATALNMESLCFFLFLFVYINSMYYCS